ncbi:hypothetical protein [Methylobacterium sp. B1]|uniref:hypothetical protein n=1 Tax=Methylobacterium sp. B1 TaxID=91459 RepID=UPI000344A85E|nr:hypothetical protein [Methylobacterium sp. B1]
MCEDPERDWGRYADWSTANQIKRVYLDLSESTYDAKKLGWGCLPKVLTEEEAAFLRESCKRLSDPGHGLRPGEEGVGRVAEARRLVRDRDGPLLDWETWFRAMGLAHDVDGAEDAPDEGREFVLAQHLTMQPVPWQDPAQSIVYAAAQAAVHATMGLAQGQVEPDVSAALIANFASYIRNSFVKAMKWQSTPLPRGSFLDVLTATMSDNGDRLGSDFAVVTGFLLHGRPKYRIALFQAKWEDSGRRNQADVWRNEGQQLAELHATGMGHYVFYPRHYDDPSQRRPVFFPTVRSAEDVRHDTVGSSNTTTRHVNTCVGGSKMEAAWDFGSFLGMTLASSIDGGPGIMVDTPDEVAQILSAGRKKPLTHHVLAYDRTVGRSLNFSALAERCRWWGYDETVHVAVPTETDEPSEDDRPSMGM